MDDCGLRVSGSGAALWRGIAPYFRPYLVPMLISSALMLAASVVDVLIPVYQKYVIDRFIVPGTVDGISGATALWVGAIAAQAAITSWFCRIAIRIEMGIARDLRKRCFDHLQELSISYYTRTPVGYMIARVMSDTDRIGTLMAWGVTDLLWGASYVVFAIFSMLVMDFRLGLWLVALMPVIIWITMIFQRRMIAFDREVRRINSLVTGAFNEGISGARTTKTLAAEEPNVRKFNELTAMMYRGRTLASRSHAHYTSLMTVLGAVGISAVLVRGGLYAADGAIDLGTLSAMAAYAIRIFQPIRRMSELLIDITAVQVNIERVLGLLSTPPETADAPEVVARYGDAFAPKRENWEPVEGDIEFDDVAFKYPGTDTNVLEHFSLKIPRGRKVAIVGETGAGKSTIVDLVCRFYEPTSGRVLIDGRDARERSALWLRSSIGYVLQTPHLFSGTVRDNIAMGRPDASDDELMAAARLVSADKVIARMPEGLDSRIGEGGDTLSTGEKQLLSFARAVAADPRIFILDEATSSIDTETERAIQDSLEGMLAGRTSLIIAHRLSTVMICDEILVIDSGKIIERGTHDELIAKDGRYAELCELGFGDEE